MASLGSLIDQLYLIQKRLVEQTPTPLRPWIAEQKLRTSQHRARLIYGPRGIGKTSYLLHQTQQHDGLYLSMDHPLVSGVSIYDLITEAQGRGISHFYLDEVQYHQSWSRDLKALYDSFPSISFIASGSNSLLLSTGVDDISRRVLGVSMPYLSFREYLVLRGYSLYPMLDPWQPDQKLVKEILSTLPLLKLFEDYMTYGFRPIFLEGTDQYGQKLLQILQKTMTNDIPFLLDRMGVNYLRVMQSILGFLSRSDIPRIQVNALCNQWNIGKEKLYQLVHAMEESGLIHVIRKKHDYASQSVGAKVFFSDPSTYRVLGGSVGTNREAFVATSFLSMGYSVWATSKEEQGDFIIEPALGSGHTSSFIIEVGGLKKERKQADYVVRYGLDYPISNTIPCWILGFGW